MLIKSITVVLFLLLILRLAVCVCSSAGIGWDFTQYYRTGNWIFLKQEENLYTIKTSSMHCFQQHIGEHVSEELGVDNQKRNQGCKTTENVEELITGSGRLGYIGFPISAYIFAPLAAFTPRQALLIFKVQCALFFVAALSLLYRSFQNVATTRMRKDLILPLYLTICLFYEPFWFVFTVGGQATPINLLLFVLFHNFYVQKRSFWAAFFLSVGILIKPFFALILLIYVFALDSRFLRNLIVLLGLWSIFSISLLGWSLHMEWLNVIRDSTRGLAEPWWNNSSILGFFYNFWSWWHGATLGTAGEVHGLFMGVIFTFKIFVIVLFFWLVRNTQAQNLEPQQYRHQLVSLSIMFALLFSNICWPHYLAFLFVPVLFLLVTSHKLTRYGKVLVWLILLSTLSVQSRFAQKYVLSFLTEYSFFQTLMAGMFGSATLILTTILLIIYHGDVIRSQWGLKLFPQNAENGNDIN